MPFLRSSTQEKSTSEIFRCGYEKAANDKKVPYRVDSEVFVLQKLLVTPISDRSFCTRRFFRALPEFFRGWAESAFCRDDADRKWLRLRSEVQKFYSVSETVTKVRTNGVLKDTGHWILEECPKETSDALVKVSLT
jgi:hypothetical protein